MLRATRLLLVTSLTTALITIPWNDAIAGERANGIREAAQSQAPDASANDDAPAVPEPVTSGAPESSVDLVRLPALSGTAVRSETIWRTTFGALPGQSPRVLRQAVASTNQHNFLLGATAAALVIGGVGLIAYSTTPSCKEGRPTACDRDKVLGAIGISGGTILLVLWALSK